MLRGLRVLEISGSAAAPLGGAALARLGAEVVRVDRLGAPAVGSPSWASLNEGKSSILVDGDCPAGRELIVRLAVQAGVVLSDAPRPDYEELSARRPGLIHVLVEEDASGPPPGLTPHAWDAARGLYAALAILAADRHRLVTGRGSALRVTARDVASLTGIGTPDAAPQRDGWPAPVPGADAEAVLSRLGLGPGEVARLRAEGTIG